MVKLVQYPDAVASDDDGSQSSLSHRCHFVSRNFSIQKFPLVGLGTLFKAPEHCFMDDAASITSGGSGIYETFSFILVIVEELDLRWSKGF